MGDWTVLGADAVGAGQEEYLRRMAAPRFFAADSAEAWGRHAGWVRGHVLECLGLNPLPERPELDVHVAGVVEHDSYVMKRLYWQSWPGYYASGWLYQPRDIPVPSPGILLPHGHWENGARHPVVQARCIALATRGYVALAVDSVHAYHWAAGMVPMTVMTWNNIRGLDLLCSMPEVDAGLLGCTGCSGGGQQTFYLMAIEDRLPRAPRVLTVGDLPQFAGALAPRPVLLAGVDNAADYAWTTSAYEALGAGDRVKVEEELSESELVGWLIGPR